MPVPAYAWAMKRVAGPVREGELGLWSPGGRVRPCACRPIRIGPPCGVIVRSGAPQSKRRSPLWAAAGRLLHLIPSLAERRGRVPCACRAARSDRPQARTLGAAGTDASLSYLIADRAWDRDASRAWRAPQGIEAIIPARSRRTNPQPRGPERYPARHAGARGLGGIKAGAAWSLATPHTRRGAWVFCTWQQLGSG